MQHIAFATDDIFATVARLEANGVALLPIPENYYDDLEAKTDLSAERDRRAEGAQHPLRPGRRRPNTCRSTPQTFEDRFFFEIVERRGYKGFGAANAPIRLAAQARLVRGSAVP